MSRLTRQDPEPGNSKNSETLWIYREFPPDYNAIFFCCPKSLQVGEINPGKFGYFRILFSNSQSATDRKKQITRRKLLLLIRSIK